MDYEIIAGLIGALTVALGVIGKLALDRRRNNIKEKERMASPSQQVADLHKWLNPEIVGSIPNQLADIKTVAEDMIGAAEKMCEGLTKIPELTETMKGLTKEMTGSLKSMRICPFLVGKEIENDLDVQE
jgi:hypothetical protein